MTFQFPLPSLIVTIPSKLWQLFLSVHFSSRSFHTATFTSRFLSLQDRRRYSASCVATAQCCLFGYSRDALPWPVNFWHRIRCSHRHAGVLGVLVADGWRENCVWTTLTDFKWEQEKEIIEDSNASSNYWSHFLSHFLSTLGERRKEYKRVYSHQHFFISRNARRQDGLTDFLYYIILHISTQYRNPEIIHFEKLLSNL